MKKILAVLLSSWCGCALAQIAQELIDNGKNSENVTTFGMGYHLNQYSPLSQINKSNVKRLVPIWSTSLSNDAGELAQPTIYNGVMYVVNGHWTFALDVATGQQIWRTPVEYERGAARVGQPGVIMRGGATIYDGKLFRETIDCHVVALEIEDWEGDLETEVRRLQGRLHRHNRSSGSEWRRNHWDGRWRSHHARLPRWLGAGNRQKAMAPVHHPRSGRTRL